MATLLEKLTRLQGLEAEAEHARSLQQNAQGDVQEDLARRKMQILPSGGLGLITVEPSLRIGQVVLNICFQHEERNMRCFLDIPAIEALRDFLVALGPLRDEQASSGQPQR